ncbi:LLM class flavin-dependent oxidoreductase [Amycolatopsis pithecellobii]|uniref:MsnO8 family LLM class oxidoreductase n=1 Tax=Amycolatopsis pithecellobii TaxID=664692 RepID=A0A6N7Z2Y0_9PSEU|nr:LLM class flavin-dependent oxidoreductase [Amycolatopsis pithecellobii]MTD55359.1 MsnO8 family LLM class oxidoreductase [Amycolatopsis pithecellobii]
MVVIVPLSVLDLVPIASDGDAVTALHNTLDLARHAERLGCRRYWIAEHHNIPGVASAATAVLVGQVASATARIRVGSGGIMLPNHAPLIVAEQFGTLDALHPERIDLGVGRAPGTDQRTALAVRGARTAEDFPAQLSELLGYFEPDETRAVNAVPAIGRKPQVWLLGSSGFSARLAGRLGLPFVFAHHLSARNTLPAVQTYRESFEPSEALGEPLLMLSVAAICAETEEQADWLAGPVKLRYLSRRHGNPIRLPSPEAAAAYAYTEEDRRLIDGRFGSAAIGSPETVRKRLDTLVTDTGAAEVMVTTMVHGHADRVRSYELLAG